MEPASQPGKTLRLRSVKHLAIQLGISPYNLLDVSRRAPDYYHDFDREVKGKLRHLCMARPPLAPVQRRILDRILCRLPVSEHAYGAIKGRTIRDNALAHACAVESLSGHGGRAILIGRPSRASLGNWRNEGR